jgi:hypothetical protein
MIYEFKSEAGQTVEREFDAVDVPDEIEVDGVLYRAQFWTGEGVGIQAQVNKHERHVAYTLPRAWQDPTLRQLWSKFDERGHVVCEGKRDRVELAARLRSSPDPKHHQYAWDAE